MRHRQLASLAAKAAVVCMAVGLAGVATAASPAQAGPTADSSDEKPRVIIQTDGEVDDQNSLTRALLYANDVDIQGIISSEHDHHPDSKTQWAKDIIADYGEVYPNLKVHDQDYPTASSLESVVAEDRTIEATNLVIDELLDDDPREVWYLVWGPFEESSLGDVMTELQGRTEAEQTKALSKLRVYSIFGQSLNELQQATWFPGKLKVIVSKDQFGAMGYGTANSGYDGIAIDPADGQWRSSAWQRNYEDHGALSDNHTGPDDGKPWIHEGDTPSFLHVIPNGLRSVEDPTFGGWGGRFEGPRLDDTHWTDTGVSENGYATKPVTRWFSASEQDYAARNDWANTASYADANHEPVVNLNGANDLSVEPGSTVNLSVSATDPDGDNLSYAWSYYDPASTFDGDVNLRSETGTSTSFTFPEEAEGETVHVIVAVTDNGTPSLTRYERIVITGDGDGGTTPPPPPPPTSLFEVKAMSDGPGSGWVVYTSGPNEGERQWIDEACRAELIDAGVTSTVVVSYQAEIGSLNSPTTWRTCDQLLELADDGGTTPPPPPPTTLFELRVKSANPGSAWIVYTSGPNEGERQWVSESCRNEVADAGVTEKVITNYQTDIGSLDSVTNWLTCEQLMPQN